MTELPTAVVEVGFGLPAKGTNYFMIGRDALGGTAVIALSGTYYTALPAVDVVEFTVSQPAEIQSSPLVGYSAGTATIVLNNNSGQYDPDNLAGPYVLAGASRVQPEVPIRIRMIYKTISYFLFVGTVDDWGLPTGKPGKSLVTVTATDAFKIFASHERTAQGASVGSNEGTGARINRILDSIGWPAADREISTGASSSGLQGTLLPGDALSELRLVADTELGELFIKRDGKVKFSSRRAHMTTSRYLISNGTFGSGPGELPYVERTVSSGFDRLRNSVHASSDDMGGEAGAEFVENVASVDRYARRSYDRFDLQFLATRHDRAINWAGLVVGWNKEPERWVSELALEPQGAHADELHLQILGRSVGDRITVKRRPPGITNPISQDLFVRGRTISWKKPKRLFCTWQLQSATAFSHYLTIGDEVLTAVLTDDFNRTVANAWGNAPTGQTYTHGSGSASDYNVGSGVGTHLLSSVNVSRRSHVPTTAPHVRVKTKVSVSAVATGAGLRAAAVPRSTDFGNDHQRADLRFDLSGALAIALVSRVGGGDTTLDTLNLVDTYTGGTTFWLLAETVGGLLRAKAWPTAGAEPVDWQIQADVPIITVGQAGVRSFSVTGNTNSNPTVTYDDLEIDVISGKGQIGTVNIIS